MMLRSAWRPLIESGVVFLAVVLSEPAPAAQAPSHIVIPFLANTANVADLNFEGADCDVEQSGNQCLVMDRVIDDERQFAPQG